MATKVIWPEFINLKRWADTLVGDYSDQYLPILYDVNNWQDWAMKVAGSGIFAQFNVPKPFSFAGGKKMVKFDDWRPWAKSVYSIMLTEE
jgi:hypothetical protein